MRTTIRAVTAALRVPAALLALPLLAVATPLPPGSSANGSAALPGSPGTLVAGNVFPFRSGQFMGSLYASVFNTGTSSNRALSFEYQVKNQSSSSGNVTGVSFPMFGFFPVEVDLSPGMAASVNRDQTLGLSFSGEDAVEPGDSSSPVVIHTSASEFTTGAASIEGGGASANSSAFVPVSQDHHVPGSGGGSSVPEPATLLLMGSGLLALGSLRGLKKKRS